MKKRRGRRRPADTRNVAVLERDAARAYRNSHPVGQALRALNVIARRQRRKPS